VKKSHYSYEKVVAFIDYSWEKVVTYTDNILSTNWL